MQKFAGLMRIDRAQWNARHALQHGARSASSCTVRAPSSRASALRGAIVRTH